MPAAKHTSKKRSLSSSPAVKNDSETSKMEICGQNKVKEAVNALKLLNKKFIDEDLKKQPLLEDTAESPIYLQVMLKKIPPPQLMKMIRVPLPHSLITETSEVCLITGDLEKRDHKAELEPTILHYKDLLRKQGVTKVSQVIPLRQLRTEYKTFESKRQLAAAFDVFLVDKKIAGVMGKTLGKSFFQSRKFPIQIDMKRPNLKEQIDKALSQTEFSLTCRGNSYALEVARLSMEDAAIQENIKTCIEVLINKLPGHQNNIFSLYIKTAKSKAIPIYVSLDIPDDILIKKPRKNGSFQLGELSTQGDAEVKVFRDGKVIVRKMKKKSSSCEDTAKSDKRTNLNEPILDDDVIKIEEDTQESVSNESSVNKKKKKKSTSDLINNIKIENEEEIQDSVVKTLGKKKEDKKASDVTDNIKMEKEEDIQVVKASGKKKRKSKKPADLVEAMTDAVTANEDYNQYSANKASPKEKKSKKSAELHEVLNVKMENEEIQDSIAAEISPKKRKKGKKSILEQVSDEVELKNEKEIQNFSSSHSSKKKNKKNRNSNFVEADDTVVDIPESNMLLSSKKRKIHLSDNVDEKAQKDKKRKVSESEDSNEIKKSMKSKPHKKISALAEEDINMNPALKSKKEKRKSEVGTIKKELPFMFEEEEDIICVENTPLKSKKKKKAKKIAGDVN